jgi:hypothetical protein
MNERDKKRDKELAEQCYVNPSEFDYKKYADLIRADEREKVIAEFVEAGVLGYDGTVVQEIRAMGNT